MTPENFFRHPLAQEMFYRPVVLRSLRGVRYALEQADQQAAARRFAQGMARLDERWAGSTFPSSSRIAASLHY